MASGPGYRTTFKLAGTPVQENNMAMSTYSTVARTFRVTNSAKCIISRDASFQFKGNGTNITTAKISSFNWLFGTVTFTSAPATPVTVSATYVPVTAVAGAHKYDLSVTRELLEDTDYTSTGWRTRTPGLIDIRLTVSRFHKADLTFYDVFRNAESVVVEINHGGQNTLARGWFIAESNSPNGDVGGLENDDLTLMIDSSEYGALRSFGWGDL